MPSTREWHSYLLILIFLSWFGLGFWKGWGYCAITDMHWSVKKRRKEELLTDSYVKYLLDKVFKRDFDPIRVNQVTVGLFAFSVLANLLTR